MQLNNCGLPACFLTFSLPFSQVGPVQPRPTVLGSSSYAVIRLMTVGRTSCHAIELFSFSVEFKILCAVMFFFSLKFWMFFEQANVEPLSKHLQEVWNEPNAVPMDRWLVQSVSQDDRRRLHQLGNCVVPSMAALAMDILTRVKSRGSRFPV